MTDAIEKKVWMELYNNFQEKDYVFPLMTDLTGQLGRGDTIEIPNHSSAPTDSVATTRAAPESYTPSVTTLSLNQDVFYNVSLPAMETPQRLGGAWATQLARRMAFDAKNAIDSNLIDYLNTSLAYDSSATYHVNPAADTLTDGDLAESIALVLSNTGRRRDRLAFLMHPYGSASVRAIADFVPANGKADSGDVGLPALGFIGGIPVYESTQINRQRTVAATASAISSNVITLTVAAGHGIVPGQKITTAGATADIDTAAAVTSVTATTVVAPLTACDDGTNGAATITVQSTENLLVDRDSVFVALQQAPHVRRVPDPESAGDALQLFTSYGRVGETTGIAVLNSPVSSIA